MAIRSPSTCNITLGLRPRVILLASGKKIVMALKWRYNSNRDTCAVVHQSLLLELH